MQDPPLQLHELCKDCLSLGLHLTMQSHKLNTCYKPGRGGEGRGREGKEGGRGEGRGGEGRGGEGVGRRREWGGEGKGREERGQRRGEQRGGEGDYQGQTSSACPQTQVLTRPTHSTCSPLQHTWQRTPSLCLPVWTEGECDSLHTTGGGWQDTLCTRRKSTR